MANLSEEKGLEPVPQWAFIGFNLHRNTGKADQSLSGSNSQIDNIPRRLWRLNNSRRLILSQGKIAKRP